MSARKIVYCKNQYEAAAAFLATRKEAYKTTGADGVKRAMNRALELLAQDDEAMTISLGSLLIEVVMTDEDHQNLDETLVQIFVDPAAGQGTEATLFVPPDA